MQTEMTFSSFETDGARVERRAEEYKDGLAGLVMLAAPAVAGAAAAKGVTYLYKSHQIGAAQAELAAMKRTRTAAGDIRTVPYIVTHEAGGYKITDKEFRQVPATELQAQTQASIQAKIDKMHQPHAVEEGLFMLAGGVVTTAATFALAMRSTKALETIECRLVDPFMEAIGGRLAHFLAETDVKVEKARQDAQAKNQPQPGQF